MWGALTIFVGPEKVGVLPCPGVAGCFVAVQAVWNSLAPLRPGKMLAEQRTRLSLKKFFS
ncbi:hypothetical protein I79_009760 [Cricetulus griseus]|uniref:Uncharacterized protein n=1 Tax=Cricetulus griseus TaxID=10029 RepID=G3HGM1_CRIGR|nr:hypothetical protein I79_009760 [Cricetulus griseus]